jgi:ketosteroid isomerase-like protein
MKTVLMSVALYVCVTGISMAASHPNVQLIERFYAAFNAHDAKTMAACYRPDATFSDEVFPELKGAKATGMWRMLCTNGKDLRVVASGIEADDSHGKAHWEAWYTFSATNRKVHNVIEAKFDFKDGLIAHHVDRFDFWAWSEQALGATGTWLGWSSLLKYKVRRTAAKSLEKFLQANP